jgi:hypothetical protein
MKTLLHTCLCIILLCDVASSQDAGKTGFRSLRVDAGKAVGERRAPSRA